jgi:hypothetical protein
MTQLLADANLSERLERATETVEIVNAQGVTIGVYTPMRFPRSPYSREEIERRRRDGNLGRPLAEIMARLHEQEGS